MRERAAFLTLLVAAGGLLVAWSFVVPIFESPDEPHHWQYARHLHDERRLPPFSASFVEGNSPPLYYAIIAPVAEATESPPGLVWHDAFGNLVIPFPPRFFHNAGGDLARYWPLRLARLITALLMLGAVAFVYLTGRELTGRPTTALLAAALVAFLPQFTFRGATISNDSLVTTLAAATTYFMVRILRRGFTWPVGILASIALAGAYLSKINAICLVPPLALTLLMGPGPWSARLRRLSVMGVALALVAPWSLRNVVLYGDPFASGAMRTAVAVLVSEKPLTSLYFLTVFPAWIARSSVGAFGWLNVWLPRWAYLSYWLLGVIGLVGAASVWFRRELDRRIMFVLALTAVLALAVVVHINRTFHQPQGRYLFPGLPAFAALVAVGLEGLPGCRRWRRATAVGIAGGLAIANGVILTRTVMPAYYPPVTARLSIRSVELKGDEVLRFAANLPARDFRFLQFELSGHAPLAIAEGSVYITQDGHGRDGAERIPFRWRPDGVPRQVTIPLLRQRTWQGNIAVVRIDPFDGRLESPVRLDRVRLRGSLDR
jgi:4-amino-4-deoxy-L-arabinose transferase-like glycosyltransferase